MITRRSFFAGGASLGIAAALGSSPVRAATRRAPLSDVFQLGVASGEPAPHGVVLWTRLAMDPIALDGLGGMPDRPVPVRWQVARDEGFKRIVRRGEEIARPEDAHSVHVEVGGLEPGAEYFYRFRVTNEISPVGRTLTAPAPGTHSRDLHLSFTSCADYQLGWFTPYRRMAEDHPDLIGFVGDYIYEYGDYKNAVRDQAGGECFDLAGYRLRHSQHKADPDLQAAHAIAPWVVVFDDHDVENAWAADVPEQPDPPFLPRRAAAFKAFYENMPLRRAQKPVGPALHLYRSLRWGSVANLHMLDTRQYRDFYACIGKSGMIGDDCTERLAPNRTILGDQQEAWLRRGLEHSRATWDVLVQQVFLMQMDWSNGPGVQYSNEGWDGYAASRNRVAAAIDDHKRNGVVLTGDVHSHWAGEIKRDYQNPESKSVAVELVTTSVTSARDGLDEYPNTKVLLSENPHVKFFNGRRGYVRSVLSKDAMKVDFRSVGYVSRPDAPAYTSGSFVIEPGTPSLNPV
ncbi:alkaline phosphatase D family protein [Actinoallomurus purpureus]|uniref:alkaline phosphatase D family protein n=1 Tax=Actinoallomurus purpureus TaxID=478114 RepID=UPI0020925A0D|nr:alkaline phosphatase D family protein [Actinoallomurus purpureus]MCO6006919.1 alkaline phosphatase D family protein [Actinoallomurus purpureus]